MRGFFCFRYPEKKDEAMTVRLLAIVAVLTMLVLGCANESPSIEPATEPPPSPELKFVARSSPAGAGSGQPFLATDDGGRLVMSWQEPAGEEKSALRFARLEGDTWSTPITIAERADFFVNFADFPSVISSGGTLFAHWLQKSGPSTYAYDVRLATSSDGGSTWSEPIVVHDDGTQTEHGFVSMLPLPQGNGVAIAWLDGREMAGGDGHGGHGEDHGNMTLRYAEVDAQGQVSKGALLDERTCECCQTAMAMTGSGPLVAYRDRSETEIRDVSVVRQTGDGWSAPATLWEDAWEINGCPVNGPQADARGQRAAIAWFTAAGDAAQVKVAFSSDGGATFAAPVEVASGDLFGAVDVLFLSDEMVVVSWLEGAGERAVVKARTVTAAGEAGPAVNVGETTKGRSGFPRMALAGDQLYIAWTEKGEGGGARLASASVSTLAR